MTSMPGYIAMIDKDQSFEYIGVDNCENEHSIFSNHFAIEAV